MDLDLALCRLDLGVEQGEAGEGDIGICIFFYLSLGVRWGLPAFSSLSLSPFTQHPAPVQREASGQRVSPHGTTLIHQPWKSYCELGAGVLGSGRSSLTNCVASGKALPTLCLSYIE